MGFLDKEVELLNAIKAKPDGDSKKRTMGVVSRSLQSFPEYMNVVVREQIMIPIWKNTLDGPEYREQVQSIDASRRNWHNNAINSINILNRVSDKLGLPPFATVDTDDRHAVAEFIEDYCCEIYEHGITPKEALQKSLVAQRREYKFEEHAQELSDEAGMEL